MATYPIKSFLPSSMELRTPEIRLSLLKGYHDTTLETAWVKNYIIAYFPYQLPAPGVYGSTVAVTKD